MSFPLRIGFLSESAYGDFVTRFLPRLPGTRLEPQQPEPAGDESAFRHLALVAVSSATAAKDLCHQLNAFLAHHKNSGIRLEWEGADGTVQTAQLTANAAKESEIVALRLGAAIRAAK